MRTPCKYAHEVTYRRLASGEMRDITVNKCWAVKEPFACSDKGRELCRAYKPLSGNTELSWIPTDGYDEQYGDTYKCARCGKEIIGTSNYCPHCGYEYEPWDGTTFK